MADLRSERVARRHGLHRPSKLRAESRLGSFSLSAYLCLCLNAVALKYYEMNDWYAYSRLTVEDSLIENLTAVLLISAGTLLFVTGRME